MHQPCTNGAHLNGDAARNGDLPPGLRMSQTDQEIVRLIGQHLLSVGLERSATLLMEESGLHLEHPAAATFRTHVLAGDWVKADHDLRALHDLLRDSPQVEPHNLAEMKFVVLEQKYLEHLEAGRVLDALHVLRNELTPLQYDTARVHRLSALMMCADAAELRQRARWPGGPRSRARLLATVQAVLPPALMMSPGRLRALLAQAAAQQAARCRFHAAPRPSPPVPSPDRDDELAAPEHIPFSLLADHHCSADQFPIHSLQVLNGHCDEVWYCKWSPDGSKLASGSKDNTVMIWDYNPVTKRLAFRKSLEGHSYGVSFLAWSPDGRHLLAAGPEDCPDLWIWNMETEQLHLKMTHSQEDSLTAAAWHASGNAFVCGGARGQFYHCALDGTLINNWDGVRVNALACRSEGRVLAADTHHRVRLYDFSDLTDRNLIQEEHAVMAMTLNAADTLLLLNVANQGVHLWDIRARALVRRFRGLSQGHFTIHACFGGAHQDFIASGSEDNKVYIWHIDGEEPIAVVSGHTRCVNAVAWNPVHHDVLVSASDDYSLRLWGPRTHQT
ncbi:WD repeat-containing protein 26 [Danaus plexippus plexippus]|uniref:WD repeat-containing protein 26 n=1 Tax=Danaus plexippus plexippus TaxID=278856 RepID=A0A212F675_DANPL|nr:WD repeat-containing protein 26 [Danaus plexippus plexippus]